MDIRKVINTVSLRNYWVTGTKIVCVGRNYAEHAKELGNEVPKGKPLLFLKPTTSYVRQGNPIIRPNACNSLHHEVELGVIIHRTCKKVSVEDAMDYVAGYTIALDMTARDLQDIEKKKGQPWTEGKCWDTFCPIGEYIPRDKVMDPQNLDLWLKVNDVYKQRGNTSDMIFPIPEIISHVSSIMTLKEGDLILTGTPAGVGEVKPGDVITAGIKNLDEFTIKFDVTQE